MSPWRETLNAGYPPKYGIHWYMSLWGSLLVGRVPHRLVMELEIADDAKPC